MGKLDGINIYHHTDEFHKKNEDINMNGKKSII